MIKKIFPLVTDIFKNCNLWSQKLQDSRNLWAQDLQNAAILFQNAKMPQFPGPDSQNLEIFGQEITVMV